MGQAGIVLPDPTGIPPVQVAAVKTDADGDSVMIGTLSPAKASPSRHDDISMAADSPKVSSLLGKRPSSEADDNSMLVEALAPVVSQKVVELPPCSQQPDLSSLHDGCLWLPTKLPALSGCGVFRVAAGGDHSFVIRVVHGSVLSTPPGCMPKVSS